MTATNDPSLGMVIANRYILLERLGEGHSGVIYRAEHAVLRNRLAVKLLHDTLAQDEQAVQRYHEAVTVAARIESEHIVKVTDFGRDDGGRLFVAMDYLEGETLAELLAREGKLEEKRAAEILEQVADALGEAHELGLVHGDVRPRNIFVTRRRNRESVRLLDLGLSMLLPPGKGKGRAGEAATDPRYVSPEHARGQEIVPRSDIYALAVVGYELVNGSPPFVGTGTFDVLTKHLEARPLVLADKLEMISEHYSGAIDRALAKRAERRYPTVERFVDALTGRGPVQETPEERTDRQKRRTGAQAAVSAPAAKAPAAPAKDALPASAPPLPPDDEEPPPLPAVTTEPGHDSPRAEPQKTMLGFGITSEDVARAIAEKEQAQQQQAPKHQQQQAPKQQAPKQEAQQQQAPSAGKKGRRGKRDRGAASKAPEPIKSEPVRLGAESKPGPTHPEPIKVEPVKLAPPKARTPVETAVPAKAEEPAKEPVKEPVKGEPVKLEAAKKEPGKPGGATPAAPSAVKAIPMPTQAPAKPVPVPTQAAPAKPVPVPTQAAPAKPVPVPTQVPAAKASAPMTAKQPPVVSGAAAATQVDAPAGDRQTVVGAPGVVLSADVFSAATIVPSTVDSKAVRERSEQVAKDAATTTVDEPTRASKSPAASSPEIDPAYDDPESPHSQTGNWFAEGVMAERALVTATKSQPLPAIYGSLDELDLEPPRRISSSMVIVGVVGLAVIILGVIFLLKSGGDKPPKRRSGGELPLLVKGKASADSAVQADSAKVAQAVPDAAPPATPDATALAVRPEPIKPEPIKPEVKPEPVKPAVKPEPVRPAPVRPAVAIKPARKPTPRVKPKPRVVRRPPVRPAIAPNNDAANARKAAAAQVATGRAQLRRGSYGKARDAFLEALKLNPKSAAARGGLGEVAFELGNYAGASAHLSRALRLNPRNGRYLVMLGNVYFKQGKTAAAVEQYRRALRINGNNREARSGLDAALRRMSRGS